MIIKNQKGLTLIEILSVLTLLAIVGLILFSILLQGTKYSNAAMSTNQMQQEANIILTNLKKWHQTEMNSTGDTYSISSSDCKITLQTTTKTEVFENSKLCFEITGHSGPVSSNISITLLIKDKDFPNNEVRVNTFLYRL